MLFMFFVVHHYCFFNYIELSLFEKFTDEEIKIILILMGASIYLNIFQSVFQTGINSIGKFKKKDPDHGWLWKKIKRWLRIK